MNFIYFIALKIVPALAILFYIQYILSKKHKRLPGLILPAVIFTFSLVLCLSCFDFGNHYFITASGNKKYEFTNKQDYENKVTELSNRKITFTSKLEYNPYSVKEVISCFFLINCITAILVFIYILTQIKYTQNKKMLIQDL